VLQLIVPDVAPTTSGLFVVPRFHSISFAAATAALMVVVLLRFGLVAFALMMMFEHTMTRLPITLDLAAWYAGPSLVTSLGVGALALNGLHLVLNGQPRFGGSHRADMVRTA